MARVSGIKKAMGWEGCEAVDSDDSEHMEGVQDNTNWWSVDHPGNVPGELRQFVVGRGWIRVGREKLDQINQDDENMNKRGSLTKVPVNEVEIRRRFVFQCEGVFPNPRLEQIALWDSKCAFKRLELDVLEKQIELSERR